MVAKLDVNSSYFKSLPPEVQHDLLIEKKEMVKHTYTPVDCLPKVLTYPFSLRLPLIKL